MPPAAGNISQIDRVPLRPSLSPTAVQPLHMAAVPEAVAKDAIIAWFRGEFAAANAIIDSLCSHLTQVVGGGAAEYESLFAAIHRRRLNWIPILQMQKYFSIADVTLELQKVAARKAKEREAAAAAAVGAKQSVVSVVDDSSAKKATVPEASAEEYGEIGSQNGEAADSIKSHDSPESEITDEGSSHGSNCEEQQSQIKITKGFSAREHVKGHMVNVVRGLKLYEDAFSPAEISRLNGFMNELRVAGQNGELSGETFVLYNQQVKGKKREMIQLGVPIFSHTNAGKIDPIPPLIESVITHLIQCHFIPDTRRPNGCIITFFDEGEYSQPFLKPPHLDQPISTLLLSDSTMAFGRTLVNNNEGSYIAPLMLSLKQGSVLVMRGNSAETARHAMCSSPNKRVSVTLFRVRAQIEKRLTAVPPVTLCYRSGVAPVVVLPVRKSHRGGTGVFLPWRGGSTKKHVKQLPPRAQRARLLALPSTDDDDGKDI